MTVQRRTFAVGDRLPELALPTIDGRAIRLSDYKGTRLLMFMWASW